MDEALFRRRFAAMAFGNSFPSPFEVPSIFICQCSTSRKLDRGLWFWRRWTCCALLVLCVLWCRDAGNRVVRTCCLDTKGRIMVALPFAYDDILISRDAKKQPLGSIQRFERREGG